MDVLDLHLAREGAAGTGQGECNCNAETKVKVKITNLKFQKKHAKNTNKDRVQKQFKTGGAKL